MKHHEPPVFPRPPLLFGPGDIVAVADPGPDGIKMGYKYLGEVTRVRGEEHFTRYVVRAIRVIKGTTLEGFCYYAHEDLVEAPPMPIMAAVLAQ